MTHNGTKGPAQRRALAQLLAALEQSGLTQRDFAEHVLLRDERVARRWINRHAPIPSIIRKFLNAAPYIRSTPKMTTVTSFPTTTRSSK